MGFVMHLLAPRACIENALHFEIPREIQRELMILIKTAQYQNLRRFGLKRLTENSYVGKVKAFMAARGLRCLSDFEKITSKDVEAHLTDLAVDRDVAPSTQNSAFHGFGSKNRMSLNFPRGASCDPRSILL